MIDDIRVCLDIAHTPIHELDLFQRKVSKKSKRLKVHGVRDACVRVYSVKGGKGLVIEGSFNGFLQGHNVIGSMDLMRLVKKVARRILHQLKIKPSREELKAIVEGHIKLERLDLVGYLKVDHLGGPSAIVRALDIGLAGSRENRMMFPGETLVYHSHSKYWSLMAYDKAAHLQAKHEETWNLLDPRVQEIAQNFLRFELRQFRRELVARGWLEVRDVNVKQLKRQFRKRLKQLLGDLRKPYPGLPPPQGTSAPSVAYLRALLLTYGHDFSACLSERAQRHERKKLKDQFGIDRRCSADLPSKHRRTLRRLAREPAFPIRHGAHHALKEAGLVAAD